MTDKKQNKRKRTLEQNDGRCVYTGKVASSVDHFPPKCLLAQPLPANLLTVPCDREFNSSIAIDEQYFLVVLSQITQHPAMIRKIVEGGAVDRALNASPKLDDRIINQLHVADDGRVVVEPEFARMDRVLSKIAAGAYFVRFGEAPGLENFASLGLHPIGSGNQEVVDLSWRVRPLEDMQIIQWSIFSYGFSFEPPDTLTCSMNFYDEFFGMVKCPMPSSFELPA